MTPIWKDHFPLLVLQATLIGWFLALLWRDRGQRRRFFLRVWISLVACSVAVAWLMAAAGRGRA